MKLSDITGAVRDLWEFVWPPVVLLTLLLAIAWFIARETSREVVARLRVESTDPAWLASLKPTLEGLGLTKLLPILGLFTIVFVLYVTRSMVLAAGHLIPPAIYYRSDVVIAKYMSNQELACLWRMFPRDIGLGNIRELAKKKAPRESESTSWSRRSVGLYGRINATKFLAVWALLLAAVEVTRHKSRGRTIARLFLVLGVCLFSAVVLLGLYLYTVEQSIHDEIRDLRALIFLEGNCSKPDQPSSALSAENLTYLERLQQEAWWGFHVDPWRYGRWIYQNLLRQGS